MEIARWLEQNIGKTIIVFDVDGRRFEGRLENVFKDFFQIFEYRQRLSKVIRFDKIKDFSLKNGGSK